MSESETYGRTGIARHDAEAEEEEADKELLRATVEDQVIQWSRGKRSLAAFLATLHEVVPNVVASPGIKVAADAPYADTRRAYMNASHNTRHGHVTDTRYFIIDSPP